MTAPSARDVEEDRRVERLPFRTLTGSNRVAGQPSSIFHVWRKELESDQNHFRDQFG